MKVREGEVVDTCRSRGSAWWRGVSCTFCFFAGCWVVMMDAHHHPTSSVTLLLLSLVLVLPPTRHATSMSPLPWGSGDLPVVLGICCWLWGRGYLLYVLSVLLCYTHALRPWSPSPLLLYVSLSCCTYRPLPLSSTSINRIND